MGGAQAWAIMAHEPIGGPKFGPIVLPYCYLSITWSSFMTLHDLRNLIHSKLLWIEFGNWSLWIASWYRLLCLILRFAATRISILRELHWKLTAGVTWESNSIVLVANAPAHALNRACEQLNGRPRKQSRLLEASHKKRKPTLEYPSRYTSEVCLICHGDCRGILEGIQYIHRY
jgi:hypothetical protein